MGGWVNGWMEDTCSLAAPQEFHAFIALTRQHSILHTVDTKCWVGDDGEEESERENEDQSPPGIVLLSGHPIERRY